MKLTMKHLKLFIFKHIISNVAINRTHNVEKEVDEIGKQIQRMYKYKPLLRKLKED